MSGGPRAWLFPAEPRLFPGQRWLNIALRSLHLVGIAGIGGGFLFGLEEGRWLPFWQLTLFTGIGLMALYTYSTARWLIQLKGIAILVKLCLLGLSLGWPEGRTGLFIVVIVISGLIAHAPGRARGWSPLASR